MMDVLVKTNETGGRAMRMVTALAGVLALAAATVSGATIDELKSQYQDNPDPAVAQEIMSKMQASPDYTKRDAADFGKQAYTDTQSESIAVETVDVLRGIVGANQEVVNFGKSAYQDTQHAYIARRVVEAHQATEQYQEGISFGKIAFEETENELVAGSVVIAVGRSGDLKEAVKWGKSAFEKAPGRHIGGAVLMFLNKQGNYTEAVEWGVDAAIKADDWNTYHNISEAMHSAPDAVVQDGLTKLAVSEGVQPHDKLLPVLRNQPDDVARSVSEKIVEKHINRVLSQQWATKDEFKKSVYKTRGFWQFCGSQFLKDTVDRIAQSVVGRFDGWQGVVTEMKTLKGEF